MDARSALGLLPVCGHWALFAGTVPAGAAAVKDYGKAGEPVELVIGYQPYYTESWSGVIMRDKKFYEKYLPKGSKVKFQIGLQGAIIVNGMLAGKVDVGYVGDMPGIVSTSHPEVRDVRIVSVLGLGFDQCNIFLTRTDAPEFKSPDEALKWLDGKTVAVPKGSCTDRFAQAVFKAKASSHRISQPEHRGHHQRFPRENLTRPLSGSRQPPASFRKGSRAVSQSAPRLMNATAASW